MDSQSSDGKFLSFFFNGKFLDWYSGSKEIELISLVMWGTHFTGVVAKEKLQNVLYEKAISGTSGK